MDFLKLPSSARRAAFANMDARDRLAKKLAHPRANAHHDARRAEIARMTAAVREPLKAKEPEPKPVRADRLVPAKPKSMSTKKYLEKYDSEPHYVEAPGVRYKVAGLVSAQAVVDKLRKQGVEPTVRPAGNTGAARRQFREAQAAQQRYADSRRRLLGGQ